MNTPIQHNNENRHTEDILKKAWNRTSQHNGPSEAAMKNIRSIIESEAERLRQTNPSLRQNLLVGPWKPIVAIAASLMLLFGGFHIHQNRQAQILTTELAQIESEIANELNALDSTVWDTLVELETEATSEEILLSTLELQMLVTEGV